MATNLENLTTNGKITQEDVARHAGVSRGVVSYVVNNGPRQVAPETRDRVLKAIEELGYRPNKHAQRLMREQGDSVVDKQFGLILTDPMMLRRPYYGSILSGIHKTAHAHNCHIRFMRFFDELRNPVLFNELVHEEEISGLLLMSLDQVILSEEDAQLIRLIQARINNIVCIEWEWENIPSVNFNRAEATYKATRHLIERGHRSIFYFGQEDNRIQGYRQACLEHDIVPSVHYVTPQANMASSYDLAANLLAQAPPPTAITAGCDEVAVGLFKAFADRGVRVPEDIAVASIDNIPIAAFLTPALTTVEVPQADLGRMAVEMLINRAKQPDMPVASMLLPVKLIIRESSGQQQKEIT
ncbi:MAG: LacI family DNA-binding transcriptional regulator [Anaerolineae bacterium]|nr:LacI family DNA-binding transcriptional regulator [Anaerolineae bacterium]